MINAFIFSKLFLCTLIVSIIAEIIAAWIVFVAPNYAFFFVLILDLCQ